jgi:hypothetical protein
MFATRLTCALALFCTITMSAPTTASGQEAYRIGDRVEWTLGGIAYPSTVYNVQGDRYQVERDGYGRAVEWVLSADLRRLPGAPAGVSAEPNGTAHV